MANVPSITRRAALRALPALSVTAASPALALSAGPDATPVEELDVWDLIQQLSVALNARPFNRFHAHVYPSDNLDYEGQTALVSSKAYHDLQRERAEAVQLVRACGSDCDDLAQDLVALAASLKRLKGGRWLPTVSDNVVKFERV